MKLFLYVAGISAVGLVAGCATTGTGSSVDASKLEVMQNSKDVYIANLSMNFVLEDSSSSKATSPMIRGGGASDYAKASLTAKLNIDPATLQQITDQAYDHLSKSLQARGYVVHDYRELARVSGWSSVDKLVSPYSPSSVGSFLNKTSSKVVTYSPTGMSLLLAQGKGDRIDIGNMAKQLGKPVILADYTIHFAYFDNDADYTVDYFKNVPINGGPSRTLSASVSLGQGIQVVSGSSIEWMTEGMSTFADNGAIRLKDSVIVAGAYGENEDTTSDGTKAANAISSLLGAFSGRSSNAQEISVNAVPEYYQYGVMKAVDAANQTLITALPQHR